MKTKKINAVDLLLSKLDKEQLDNFIRRECSNNGQFQDRFLALGAGTVFKPSPKIYASRVEDLIDDYSGRRGYIEYSSTFSFNRSVTRILDEADEAMEKKQWEVAVAVLTGIASVSEEIVSCGDDSAGELGAIVNDCFEKWHELCENDSVPESLKSEIFEYALSRFKENDLKGWDWWWDWMGMAVSLADTPEKQSSVVKVLDTIKPNGDDWSSNYHAQIAQNYKLEIISRSGTPEDQIKFMYDNVSNTDFRNRLIQMAWDKSDYNEVLRLVKDGIKQDADYPGLVNGWRKWEYKVYHETGDKDNELKLALHFFFNGGGFGEKEYAKEAMFAEIKSLVPRNDWTKYVKTLISEAENKKDVVRLLYIYTQERMWQEYMAFLRKYPSIFNIDKAPKEVKELFNEEIIKLYASAVREFFQRASNRDSYRDGVELLRCLIRYGGKSDAERIAAEQRSRTPRRPALIDELSKL